jgi:hypothetical protein
VLIIPFFWGSQLGAYYAPSILTGEIGSASLHIGITVVGHRAPRPRDRTPLPQGELVSEPCNVRQSTTFVIWYC